MIKVGAIVLALSVAVTLAPIVYALNQYGWDIRPLVTPVYSPPRIDYTMRFKGVETEGGRIHIIITITNLGELRTEFEGVNATAFGPDGEVLGRVVLARSVVIEPGSSGDLKLRLDLDNKVLGTLAAHLMRSEAMQVDVKGSTTVNVLGSEATAPLTLSFPLSRKDLAGGTLTVGIPGGPGG